MEERALNHSTRRERKSKTTAMKLWEVKGIDVSCFDFLSYFCKLKQEMEPEAWDYNLLQQVTEQYCNHTLWRGCVRWTPTIAQILRIRAATQQSFRQTLESLTNFNSDRCKHSWQSHIDLDTPQIPGRSEMMVCAAREVNSLIILNNHISATFEENSGAEIQLGWTTWWCHHNHQWLNLPFLSGVAKSQRLNQEQIGLNHWWGHAQQKFIIATWLWKKELDNRSRKYSSPTSSIFFCLLGCLTRPSAIHSKTSLSLSNSKPLGKTEQ